MSRVKSKNLSDHKIVEALLRELRVNRGLRQVDVADALGIQQSVVSKYEIGERRLDVLEIRALCSLFEISPADFFKELDRRLEIKYEAD